MENAEVVMLVSVKTTMYPKHVSQLIRKDLPLMKTIYKDKTVYGAIAGLTNRGKIKDREKLAGRGVYVFSLSEDQNVSLTNPQEKLTAF